MKTLGAALFCSLAVVGAVACSSTEVGPQAQAPTSVTAPAPTTRTRSASETSEALERTVCFGRAEVACNFQTQGTTVIGHLGSGRLYGLSAAPKEGIDVWSEADAQRMMETDEGDGTQTSTDGLVSWDVDENGSLDLVIEVPS